MLNMEELEEGLKKRLKGLIDNLIQSFQTLSILTRTYNILPKHIQILEIA